MRTGTETYEAIRLTRADGVATLTLDRPKARNAVDMAMRRELRHAIESLRRDDAVRACVLIGSNGTFCAGGDIRAMRDRTPSVEAARERMRETGEIVLELFGLEKPVIAAVDGPAYGAGFGMAMAADFVVATAGARFCASFGRIGLVPDFGLHYVLPRRVGLGRAKELVFSAREVGAEEALRLGLINEIVPAASLLEAALQLASRFVDASPTALALAKTLLNRSFDLGIEQIIDAETTAQAICMETDYHRDAARRFLERRAPRFQWPPAGIPDMSSTGGEE